MCHAKHLQAGEIAQLEIGNGNTPLFNMFLLASMVSTQRTILTHKYLALNT